MTRTNGDRINKLVAGLSNQGLFIEENFLSRHETTLLAKDLSDSAAKGLFRRAGVGRKDHHQLSDEIRRDEILWLESAPESQSPAQQLLWTRMMTLKEALNQSLFLGLQSFEGHYALYPAGGFYRRHRDRFRSDDTRTVTITLYLNTDWSEDDGGELKIYLPDQPEDQAILVQPLGGTLVVFLSDHIEHEVLVSRKERRSFAGWFKRAPLSGVPGV